MSEDETSLIVTDVRTRRVRHQLTPPLSAYYAPVAIQPATGLIAAGDSMGRINVWNAETGHRQAPFQWHARICFPEHAGDVRPAVSAVSGFRGFSAADSGICPERTGGPFHEYLRGRADEDTDRSYCVAGDQSPRVRSGTPAASPKTRRPVGDFHRIARMSFAADH